MNNTGFRLCLSLLLIMAGCSEKPARQKADTEAGPQRDNSIVTKVNIDPVRSIIKWKGTKLMGTGKHEGTLNFKEGTLHFNRLGLSGGYFVTDMKSIRVTDMPATETSAIRNITNHLSSDLGTEQHPVAKFTITQVSEYKNGYRLQVIGDLTIKDVTRNVMMIIEESTQSEGGNRYTTSFSIDRFDWNIGTDGSWLEKKLVDKEITLWVDVHTSGE